MDGLLANLFDTISHKLYNKQYSTITPEEKTEARSIWVDKELFNEHFGDVETFFADLEPFGKNGELTNAIVSTVIDVVGEYRICSHPASLDTTGSKNGKITWIKTHLKTQPIEMFFPQNKAIYAKTDGVSNILIDDFPPYIAAWRNKGGIAIEMRTDSFQTVDQIKEFLTKELSAARDQIQGQVKESFNSIVSKLLSEFSA